VPSPHPTVKRPAKKAKVRGLGRLLNEEWWPLEVAIVWVATGNAALCKSAFELAMGRRASPASRSPSLATWLMTREGISTLYEATPGAIYRNWIRKDWKPGDRHGLHPLDRAMGETAEILRGHLRTNADEPATRGGFREGHGSTSLAMRSHGSLLEHGRTSISLTIENEE
jgi:hypothetical protein